MKKKKKKTSKNKQKTKKNKNKKRLQHGPYTTMDRSYGQDLATATGGLSSSTTCNWFQQRQIRSQRIKPYFFHCFVLGAAQHQTQKEDGMQQTEDPPKHDIMKEEEEEDEEKGDKQNKGPSHHNPFGFVVKRNNEFMCISTHKLRFLDISNFYCPWLLLQQVSGCL